MLGLFSSLLIISEVLLTFCTIRFSLDSYKLRNYHHPILSEIFFNNNDLEPNDISKIFEDSNSEEINHHFVIEYLKSIKSYEEQNRDQTTGINTAQKTFIWSLALIPIFSILVISMAFFKT